MKKHLLMLLVAAMATTMSLEARTIVINEGFENGIQESEWTQEFVSGEMPWAIEGVEDNLAYPSTVLQGTHRAYLRNTTGETQGYRTRLVSKVMNLDPRKVTMPELTFWYANPKWGGDRDTLRVLYRTAARDEWKVMGEYAGGSADWQKVSLELPGVSQTYQIAFEGSDNLGRGIVLDSILLQSAPECTVPSDIVATNKGAGKVGLSWTASWDAYYFEVIVSRDTIDPDQIDELKVSHPELIAYHDSIDGLQFNCDVTLEAGEFYLAYIRSLCGSENSAWSSEGSKDGPFGFVVRSAKEVPFTEHFNYTTGVFRDPDWTWKSNTGNMNPYVNSKTTSATTRGYYSYDKTYALIFSGGTTTSPSTFIPADRYVYLATPALSDTTNKSFAVNQCQVRFWSTVYTYTGRQYGRSIIVGVMEDPDDITTFVPVDTVSVWGNMTFQENIVDLSSYTGTGVFVAFVSDFDRQNLFYIDDVTIEYRPEVNKVTKVTVNPRDTYADIRWEGNADSYQVLITNAEVDPSNPATSAIVDRATVNTNAYRCEALEANHSWNRPYYVYVQAEGTEWSYRYPFVTIASQREIPYSYDMEPQNTSVYKIGDSQYPVGIGVFGNSGGYPAMVINSDNSYSGSGYLYLSKRGGTDAWITLPMVENLSEVQVKFYLSGSTTFAQSHATVGVMSNPMDVNTFVPVSHFTLNAAGYTRCYANFENYNGPEGVIAILWDDVMNMTQTTINYIDEITVEELSDCVPPTDLQLAIEPDSITVSWATSLSDEWEFFLSRTALPESQRFNKSLDEIAAMAGVTVAETLFWNEDGTPVFGFGGLTPHSKYFLYVRATCDPDWWTEMAFSTPCRDEEFPYKETFENYNVGSSNVGCWQLADYMGVGYPAIYQSGTSSASNKALNLYSSGTTHRSVAILPTVEGNLSDMLLSFDVRTAGSTSSGIVIVGTMGDISDANSFVTLDTIRVSGSTFTKVRMILSNYEMSYDNIAITSGLGTLAMNSNILIDNVELKDPSCIEAYGFRQTNSDPDAIEVTWDGVSPNDQWEVKVLSTSVSLASIQANNYNIAYEVVGDSILTGKTLQVSGLEGLRNYYVYVRTLCGDSVWAMTTVRTSCSLLDPNKPNKETFESGYIPDCWTTGKGLSSDSYPSVDVSGNNHFVAMRQSSTAGSVQWIASPKIQCDTLTSILISFSISGYSGDIGVFGVMTDPTDISTFVPLDSMSLTSSFTTYSYDLSEYKAVIPASAKYCAWRGRFGIYDYVYLDDVSFVSIACPLTKPSIANVTTSTARISNGLQDDNSWLLLVTNKEVAEENLYDANYQIPEEWIVFRDTVDSRSITVSGLQGQTKYYVSAATICEDDVLSQWTTISFRTPCQAMSPEEVGVVTFAEEDGFSTGAGGEIPCWTVNSKSSGAPASCIPYIDNREAYMHDGNNYLQLQDQVTGSDASATRYVGAYAVMPELAVDSINKYQVNFWAYGVSGAKKLIVGISTSTTNMNTFMAVDTLNLSAEWMPYSVGFENYEGDYMGNMGTNVVFLSEFGESNLCLLSEVSLELIPRCRQIASFSVDSVGEAKAIVSWKGYQESYRMLLSDKALRDTEKATYHYLLDTIVDHSDRVLIENLQPITNYYVYAQGICGNGDSTDISLTYAAIRTTCPTETGVPLPFYDDFESYNTGHASPGCWIFSSASSTYPQLSAVSSTGTKAVELYSTSSQDSWIVMPVVDADLYNTILSFDVSAWSSSYTGTLYVGTMADPADPTTFALIASFPGTSTTFSHHTINLGDYDLPYDNLAFTSGFYHAMGLTTSSDVYLDNVALELAASCNPPRVRLMGTTFNGAELKLTPADRTDALWQVVVIPDSVHSTMGAAAIANYIEKAPKITVDSTHVILSGLESATSYIIYARTLCSETDLSAWSRTPLKFTTRFYFADSYFFGFEKDGELWERSVNSASDNYYLHPALEAGKDTLGAPSEAYLYYPYSREDGDGYLYARTGTGALMMHAKGAFYGGYLILPAIGEASDRSLEFKARPGYLLDASRKLPALTSEAQLEIGTIEKDKSFDTYQPLATIHMDKLNINTAATNRNNMLYSNYSLDLDAATMASRQLVLHLPKQTADSVYLLIDDVKLDAAKGFSLVSLAKITPDGSSAMIEWNNIGGPWNLSVRNEAGATVASFPALTATSQLVTGLDPQTNYTAVLEAVNPASGYVTTDKMAFRTLCLPLEPDANASFVWNFDDAGEWEANDVLGGVADSLYLKPSCFTTGITYDQPVNGYQWLVQRKGYEATGALTGYSGTRYLEVGRNDSHALRVHTTEANYNSYIVLPALNCGMDTMMIEFYGRCFANYDRSYTTSFARGRIADATYLGAAYSRSIVVGTLSDPADFSTLRVLDTLTYSRTDLTTSDNVEDDPAGLRYWEQLRMPLTGAQGRYIVLFQPAPGLFYLDDLAVKPIGNTIFAPSSTRTTNITATTATLSWTTRHPDLPTVVVLFNALGEELFRDTITGETAYTLTNLTPAMTYRWSAYQIEGNEASPSSKPLGFHTECVNLAPDYACGFEAVEGTEAINGNRAYPKMLCWTYSDALLNEWRSGTYDPFNQANTSSIKYSYAGSSALMMRAAYSSRGTSYQPYVALPAMDVAAYDTLQISFWMRPAYVSATSDDVLMSYTGSSYSKSVIVGTMTDPEDPATFVAIDTLTYDGTLSTANKATAANNFLFQQFNLDLTGATGPYVALMTSFHEKGGTTIKTGDYIWIDDIAFSRLNECKEPKNLTAVQVGTYHADLAWDGPAVAASYRVQVSTDPYFENAKAMIFDDYVETNSVRVEGLQSLTSYVWRVQSDCGVQWTESNFSTKATFTTSRSPYFLEEFSSVLSSSEWLSSRAHAENVIDTTGTLPRSTDNWSFVRTSNNYGLTGSHYVASGYSGDYHWLVSPNFYLPEEDSCHFSMDIALTACNTAHTPTGNAVSENDMKDDYYFMIIVSEDGGASWKSENILAKWQNTNPSGSQLRDIPSTGMKVRYSLASYAGKNIRIGLYREAKSTSNTGIAIHIDNFRLAYFNKEVDYTSACQYEDVQVGDIFLSGDDTRPGIHAYPTSFYVSDSEAKAGKKDSVFQLEIEVFPTLETLYADTICEGQTYTGYDFMGKSETGLYRRKLSSVVTGCDSIVALNLTVQPRMAGEETVVQICPGETYRWQGVDYTRAGLYYDTLVSSFGCDSIETLVITYRNSDRDTIRVSSTSTEEELPFSYYDFNHPYLPGQNPVYYKKGTAPGVYVDTVLVSGEACTTVLIHTLTIERHEDIDLIDAENAHGAQKVIIRDQMYIILNDEWYTPAGQKVADPRQ